MNEFFRVEDFLVGKTFNDFSLNVRGGVVEHRGSVSLATRFSRNIPLNLPIVAANMDTITGPKMCIAIAQEGGIGILPRSDAIPITLEASWVEEVKRAENFIIENPYVILESKSIAEARKEMEKRGVGTLLVTNEKEELVGMITTRRLRLCLEDNDHIYVWMEKIMNGMMKFSKASINSLDDAIRELKRWDVDKLPLVDKDFKIKGLVTSKDIANLIRHSWANKDKKGRLRVGAAIGMTGDYLERADELIKAGVDVIVMDVAHAHNLKITHGAVESFRRKFGPFELVCGNVATFEGAEFLGRLGVDGIKVGIGSGHGCLTRINTGFGVPQLHAIRAVWHAIKDSDLPIISDGGIKKTGSMTKALAIGASSIMVGSLISATDETPGELIPDPETGAEYKTYRGMTSPEAKLESVDDPSKIKNVEGKSYRVRPKGSVRKVLSRIRGNLQSAVSYSGEENLEGLRKKISVDPEAFFIPASLASQEESNKR